MNLDAADIKVPFAWYNCSAGDDKKIIVSAANIRFEEACVLFNVAACYIQFGGMESISTAEGLKKACNYYMVTAQKIIPLSYTKSHSYTFYFRLQQVFFNTFPKI